MRAGKDYFTDKAPLTTLDQLAAVREAVAQTGRKYMVNYSERLQVEAAVYCPGSWCRPGPSARWCRSSAWGPTG